MPEEYSGFLGALPDEIADKLPQSVFEGDRESVLNAAEEMSGVRYLLNALFSSFSGAVTSLLPTLALMLGVVVLSALCHVFAASSGSLSAAVSFACRLCSYLVTVGVAVSALSGLKEYFNSLFSLVAAFVPLSGVLYAMGGNLTGAASGSLTLSTTLTVCQFFFSKTVIPIFCTCLSLSLMSVFEGVGARTAGSISSMLKKWYTTALAFVSMILTAAIAGQGIISAKADNAAMRGAKFATGSFIPISGGTLSSTLGTLAASVELLRGSVGVVGIVIILLMLISVIVRLAAIRGLLSLTSFAAGVLGCTGEQKLLDEIGSLYGYLEGIAAISAVTFIIAMAVFATTAAAVAI
jgi:stage III sporulation protein AE